MKLQLQKRTHTTTPKQFLCVVLGWKRSSMVEFLPSIHGTKLSVSSIAKSKSMSLSLNSRMYFSQLILFVYKWSYHQKKFHVSWSYLLLFMCLSFTIKFTYSDSTDTGQTFHSVIVLNFIMGKMMITIWTDKRKFVWDDVCCVLSTIYYLSIIYLFNTVANSCKKCELEGGRVRWDLVECGNGTSDKAERFT